MYLYIVYTAINECLNEPCQNGATCFDLVLGYNCTCTRGYEGENCDNEGTEIYPIYTIYYVVDAYMCVNYD